MLSRHLTKRYLNNSLSLLASIRYSQRNYSKNHDDKTKHDVTQVKGAELLRSPSLNKGMAFSIYERQLLGIHGLIPPAVITQDIQAMRVMANFRQEPNPLDRYVDLCNLQQRNEKLFYRVLIDNLEEVMPIVYTPTVGLACQKYGMTYRRAKGLFITIHDKGHILDVLYNWPEPLVKAIVVTDGERILGLGDLGANGMGIPVGKLSLYTALAGIPPDQCLPIMLDVGTNNKQFLDDPFYVGIKQNRVTGIEYEEFMDEFMQACVTRFGHNCLIQFEDFASHNAYRYLEKYKRNYCMFNDDIQGTAAVVLAGILASLRVTNTRLEQNRFLFVGAGQAACGIADLISSAMSQSSGISIEEARKQVNLFDIDGLLVENRPEGQLDGPKRPFVKSDLQPTKDLANAIDQIKPTALIGASGCGGTFPPHVLRKMADINEKPIIFALSNPTSRAECTAEEAYTHTDGRCLFSSGSPFKPVTYKDKIFHPGQGNNAYIFPSIALATIVSAARHIDDDVFLIAAQSLANQVSENDLAVGRLYPPQKQIRECSIRIASEISDWYYKNNKATTFPEPNDKESFIREYLYDTSYTDYVPNTWSWPEKHTKPRGEK